MNIKRGIQINGNILNYRREAAEIGLTIGMGEKRIAIYKCEIKAKIKIERPRSTYMGCRSREVTSGMVTEENVNDPKICEIRVYVHANHSSKKHK